MIVSVTGNSGFIASNLIKELERKKVTIDPYSEGLDAIFHLKSCNLKDSINDPIKCLDLNVRNTLFILERMRTSQSDSVLVFSSTGSVYGEPKYSPQDENHPVQPTNPYTISKIACENYIRYYAKTYGLKTVILRYYNVIGKGQKKGVVPKFIDQILMGKEVNIQGDGTQVRCFTHVNDVVRANLLAAKTKSAYGLTFNIAGRSHMSILNLAKVIAHFVGEPLKFCFTPAMEGDISGFHPDISLARKVLGFTPKGNLSEALMDLIEERRDLMK